MSIKQWVLCAAALTALCLPGQVSFAVPVNVYSMDSPYQDPLSVKE